MLGNIVGEKTSLSDLPLEIIDNIVRWLVAGEDTHKDSPFPPNSICSGTPFLCLHPLVLNKRLCSVAVKHLYRDFYYSSGWPSDKEQLRSKKLLQNLISSTDPATSKVYFPYYKFVQRLAIRRFGDSWASLQALFDAILRHGQLKHLELICTLPNISPEADFSNLKSLKFRYGFDTWNSVREYWEALKPRCSGHIETLDIDIHPSTTLESFSFPTNTLKSLTVSGGLSLTVQRNFSQVFLAPHSATLKSVSLKSVNFSWKDIEPGLTFPNLTSLCLCECRVEG